MRRWGWIGLILAAARVVDAQTVRGRILDRGTDQPAAGVVVLMLGRDDRAVAQGFTDARGEYRLTSALPGEFRVRTLRIGYRPATSPVFTLAAGGEIELAPLHSGDPVALDTVRVVGRNSCEAVSGGSATFALWEQARTALTAARITARSRLMNARITTWRRSLESGDAEIRSHTAALQSGITTRPWHSLPADSLRKLGYVVADAQNWLNYYAPDLDVLLSEEFVADHCFRIAPASDAKRVGIAFEPTRARRKLPEIRGVLWIDRATSELHRLDFEYVNIDQALMDARAGGSVEFARLPNGAWLVSRWTIRMPVVDRRWDAVSGLSRSRVMRNEVTEVREEGGVLGLVTRGNDTLWRPPTRSLEGVILDSASRAPVARARVWVRGANLSATSDSVGRFRIPAVIPGRYAVEVRSPALEAFGTVHREIVGVSDTVAPATILLPSVDRLARRACPATTGGVLIGSVTARADSLPVRGRVVVEYMESEIVTNAVQRRPRHLTAATDASGRYRVCNAPVGSLLTVTAESPVGNSMPVQTQLSASERMQVLDLRVDPRAARPAAFAGVVMSDIDGSPIAEVQVLIPSVPRNAFTDDKGTFRLTNVPPGTHAVQVRKIGYRQLDLMIDFASNQTVERRLLLSRAVTLEEVNVNASAVIPSFEENRRLGLGEFWDRERLEKLEGIPLSTVLDQTQGLKMVRSAGMASWVASMRSTAGGFGGTTSCFELESATATDRGKNCGCFVQVYLDNVPLFTGRPTDEVPNINAIPVSSIEAIEFYAGPAATPARYATLNSSCGTLVIHTRRSLRSRADTTGKPGRP